jgi:hypothetical protein
MIIENELDADISGFGLNALSSGLPLNVDLDTTLTVAAGNCYRLLARKCRATSWPRLTGSGATSSTTPGPSPWQRTSSGSTSHCGPTSRCWATQASPSSTSRSRGGTDGDCASASRHAEPAVKTSGELSSRGSRLDPVRPQLDPVRPAVRPMVRAGRFELPPPRGPGPKPGASACFATPAHCSVEATAVTQAEMSRRSCSGRRTGSAA